MINQIKSVGGNKVMVNLDGEWVQAHLVNAEDLAANQENLEDYSNEDFQDALEYLEDASTDDIEELDQYDEEDFDFMMDLEEEKKKEEEKKGEEEAKADEGFMGKIKKWFSGIFGCGDKDNQDNSSEPAPAPQDKDAKNATSEDKPEEKAETKPKAEEKAEEKAPESAPAPAPMKVEKAPAAPAAPAKATPPPASFKAIEQRLKEHYAKKSKTIIADYLSTHQVQTQEQLAQYNQFVMKLRESLAAKYIEKIEMIGK